jgi:hypothetical protein
MWVEAGMSTIYLEEGLRKRMEIWGSPDNRNADKKDVWECAPPKIVPCGSPMPSALPWPPKEGRSSGRAIAQAVSRRPGFDPKSGHVGFMVDKMELGQVFSEYFGFPCQFSFHRLLHTHHHLSSEAGTVGQTVVAVPNGLSLTPPQETKKSRVSHWAVLSILYRLLDGGEP